MKWQCFAISPPTKLSLLLLDVSVGNAGFGYDAGLINGLLANPQWFEAFRISAQGAFLGIVIASQVFGGLLSILPASLVSDYLGRRWTIIGAAVINATVVYAQSFAVNSAGFLATRVLNGLAAGITFVASGSLVAELSHPHRRSQITALFSSIFAIGFIVAAWTTFASLKLPGAWSWRLPLLLQLVWPLLQATAAFSCAESPDWLVIRGRVDEARQILDKYQLPPDLAINSEQNRASEKQSQSNISSRNVADVRVWATFLHRDHIRSTFWIVFIALGSQWNGSAVVFYYLPPILATIGITSASHQLLLNFGISIFSFILAVLGAMLSRYVGRIRLLIISLAGMLLTTLSIAACTAQYVKLENRTYAIVVVCFLFAFAGVHSFGFMGLPLLYVTELMSTRLRAKAVSLYFMLGGAGICFNQFVNPIAFAHLSWRYFTVYVAVQLVMLFVLAVWAPETKDASPYNDGFVHPTV